MSQQVYWSRRFGCGLILNEVQKIIERVGRTAVRSALIPDLPGVEHVETKLQGVSLDSRSHNVSPPNSCLRKVSRTPISKPI